MHPERRRYFLVATMVALFGTLPWLAWLQYRWIGEAGRAEIQRTRASLRRAAHQCATDFDDELRRLHAIALTGGGPGGRDRSYYVGRMVQWLALTSRPKLIRAFYLTESDRNGLPEWYQFDPARGFRLVPWLGLLEPLRSKWAADYAARPRPLQPQSPGNWNDLPMLIVPRMPRAPRHDSGSLDRRPPPPWPGPPRADGWVIALLDLDYIRSNWAPELVKKYFGFGSTADYDVRIVSVASGQIIYDSDPSARKDAFDKPDADAFLFSSQIQPAAGLQWSGGPPQEGQPPALGRWKLLVRDRSGSVEAAVARGRIRNLAVSGGVLFIMASSLIVLSVAMRRSAQLATRQMQFVAAVSHELRTPLAVIRSAAENLADGIVTGHEPVKEYGVLIREEGRRLSYLVEQTLRFAGIQTGRARYNLVPTQVSTVVDDALKSCDGILRSSGCKVEIDFADGLPPVLADASALAVCIGNLLTNAARHGRSGGWIGVSACLSVSGSANRVRIEVRDRGPGIEARDVPHLFEPFYRGRKAESDQVGGTGLGLALAKQIITAHHGEITVASQPGQGSSFTLTLDAADRANWK